ncbi:M56 family metallopeptidase [bacterium LRH843]|nr:M56 family metallopeptidase [bacterium LRH843]
MQDFLNTLVTSSITMSMVALLLVIISPLLSKIYEAKWQYYAWLVIVIGFIIPFRPKVNFSFLKVDLPTIQPIEVLQIGTKELVTVASNEISESLKDPVISIYSIIGYIWIVGMILVIGYHIFRHLHFIRIVKRWSENVCDRKILADLEELKAKMGITNPVHLQRSSLITTPMIFGVVTPTILLPTTDFSNDELSFILAHELVHYKRKDIWYKNLVLLATAIHWFNPVVYLMSRSIALQCELSCDLEVVKNSQEDKRQQYCETIIGVIRQQSRLKTALSTHFYGGKETMKNRILSIMDTRKKKSGIALIFGILVLSIVVFIATDTGETTTSIVPNDRKDQSQVYEGLTESKHVIDIDVNSLGSGEGVNLGQYTLEEGDFITYKLKSEGTGNLTISFMKTDEYIERDGYLGVIGLTGNALNTEFPHPHVVPSHLAGMYYLFVGNYEGKSLENIKGTVEISEAVD